ncbi:hypothetical protein ACT3S9_16520 [Pseudoalteromonas sp. AOP31-A2-14]
MKRRSAEMTVSQVHLNFALPSFEGPFSTAMAHNTIYDGLPIAADENHNIQFICELPDDVNEGDVISLSATNITARNARYFVQHTVTQGDLEAGIAPLAFQHISHSDKYILQLMLHGLHDTLKDSIEFDAFIEAYGSGYQQHDTSQQGAMLSKEQSFKQFIVSCSSSFLSFF